MRYELAPPPAPSMFNVLVTCEVGDRLVIMDSDRRHLGEVKTVQAEHEHLEWVLTEDADSTHWAVLGDEVEPLRFVSVDHGPMRRGTTFNLELGVGSTDSA